MKADQRLSDQLSPSSTTKYQVPQPLTTVKRILHDLRHWQFLLVERHLLRSSPTADCWKLPPAGASRRQPLKRRMVRYGAHKKIPLCDYQRKGTFINQYLKGHPKTTHNPRNRHRLFCEGNFSFWASAHSPSVVSDSSVRLSVRPGILRVSSITLSYPNPFFFFCGKYR